jgi:hypothetical protein
MRADGRIVSTVEPIPTLLPSGLNALCVLELNDDGHLVRVQVKRLTRPRETAPEREVADLAERAASMVHSLGSAPRAHAEAVRQALPAPLVDMLRQLVALEDLRGDEARQMLARQFARPGVA